MDIEPEDRYGSKRIHQRMGPSNPGGGGGGGGGGDRYNKVITGIALPSGSDKLYSGSKDETVRVWDYQSGQCVGVVTMGSEVGCMIRVHVCIGYHVAESSILSKKKATEAPQSIPKVDKAPSLSS
ncbi:uncharacterized protein A4U43_C08F29580 [Asparagus officinalis]|nr:uncharacterized protein A4U43_C08F29580 [Asparagus officinalis]